MSLTKFASFEVSEVLDLKGAPSQQRVASLDKLADFEDYRTGDGYIYARIRAISSRVNQNHDGWPSIELAGSPEIFDAHRHSSDGFTIESANGNKEYGFATFVGKPIFVDHNNSDPKRARGVIRDSKFRVLDQKTAASDKYWKSADVDREHIPASEIELLLEVDANSFPKLAEHIVKGNIDGFSMGCDVDYSKCSHCGHEASTPEDYCSHITMKGAEHDFKTADGQRISKKSYENCYGIKFFEISAVFNPADETALAREVRSSVQHEGELLGGPNTPTQVDPVRQNDFEVEQLALEYEKQGIDPQTALEMAQRKLQHPAGHGEGGSPTDYITQGFQGPGGYDANPVDLSGAQQNDPRWSSTKESVWPFNQKQNDQGDSGIATGLSTDACPYCGGHGTTPSSMGMESQCPACGGTGQADNQPNANQQAANQPNPYAPNQVSPDMRGQYAYAHTAKTAENELPQSFDTKAPENVNTLRDEKLCPICGSDMNDETCTVCGYVEPPKEFDNPDLNKVEQIQQDIKAGDEAGALSPPAAPGGAPAPGGQPQGGPLTSQSATKTVTTETLNNSMNNWTPLVTPKTAARVNQVETPVIPSNPVQTNEPKKEIVHSDQTKPVTSSAQDIIARAQRNTGETMNKQADATSPGDTAADARVDTTGVGGVLDASNDAASKADAQANLEGVGGLGVEGVEADSTESLPTAAEGSDDSGFNTDKTTEDSGPTATFGDSDGTEKGVTDPVTSEPFPASEDGVKSSRTAYDDKTLEQNEQQGDPVAQGGSAVKGVKPVSEQFGDRVNVLEHKTSPSNNSGPTKTWSGTDGNGVTKQQEPTTREKQETGGVPTPDVKLHTNSHLFAAFKLADQEVELGLINREDKYERVASLESESMESIQAQMTTLSKVKTAGLNKLAQQRTAGIKVPNGIGKSFQRIASDHESSQQVADDETFDSSLFL